MWIDETYMTNAFGASTISALGLTNASVFAQFELGARATVVSAMQYAGYEAIETLNAGSVTAGFLQKLVSAVMLRDCLNSRKGIKVPVDAEATLSEGMNLLDAVYMKRVPIPGILPVAEQAYGGSTDNPAFGVYSQTSYFTQNKLNGF
jgi:hypothetical protein